MKAIHVLGVLVVVGVIATPIVSARPAYRLQAISQLELTPDANGKATITCQFCHEGPRGGKPWNAFGDNVRANFFGAAEKNIAQALYLTLKDRKDSDGDGFDDVLEILGNGRPGNPNIKPRTPKDTLEAQLKMLGGVDYFKPKPK
jgi:hypothetical protein